MSEAFLSRFASGKPNTSIEGMSCGKPQATPHVKRVCRAWHESSRVKVPVPGL